VRMEGTRIKMGGEGVAAGEGLRGDWRVSKKRGAAVWVIVKEGEGRFRGKKCWRRRRQRREEGACRERDKDRAKRGIGAGAKRKKGRVRGGAEEMGPEEPRDKKGKERYM
jgi:hypothetical protein